MTKPTSSLWHEVRYAFDRTFKTGKRRAEFETKYGRHGDYFGYRQNPYELAKYQHTWRLMKEWRRSNASALEIGCSVGVFTQMIAPEFERVTAVDIAANALGHAQQQVGDAGDVSFVQSDVQSLDLGKTFDVIFCAEVLMYVPEKEAPIACRALDRHLAPNGIIVEVSLANREADHGKFFHHWDRVLGAHFQEIQRQRIEDPQRPWEILAFARRA